jgi:hypothetical protein
VRVGPELDQGRRAHRLPGREPGQVPGLLGVGPEPGDRQTPEHHRGEVGNGRHGAPDLLEHDGGLEEPVAEAAVRLGHRHPEQAGRGQRAPELAVEAVGTGVDLLEPLGRELALQDLRGEGPQVLLLVGKVEVHWSSPPGSGRVVSEGRGACRDRTRR